MYDPIAIAALIVSIASALFVGIEEGIGLALEYRESELTQRRKKEIDEDLGKIQEDEALKYINEKYERRV